MNAGRGIVHSEMPGPASVNSGLQLWINLRSKDKMSQPDYQELLAADIPIAKSTDSKVSAKVIAGECFGVKSKIFSKTPTMYLDIQMQPSASVEKLDIPETYNAFIYVLDGTVSVSDHGDQGSHGSCIVLSSGNHVSLKAGSGGARFVLIGGEPLGEPVVQHGPFVMNTREEIMQAFRDYSDGKF